MRTSTSATKEKLSKNEKLTLFISLISFIISTTFAFISTVNQNKPSFPDIKVEWHRSINSSSDIANFMEKDSSGYSLAFIPVQIRNLSNVQATLFNINLLISGLNNYESETITFYLDQYPLDEDFRPHVLLNLELEANLKRVTLPVTLDAMELVEGYIVFRGSLNKDNFTNSIISFENSVLSFIYKTSYDERVKNQDILSTINFNDSEPFYRDYNYK